MTQNLDEQLAILDGRAVIVQDVSTAPAGSEKSYPLIVGYLRTWIADDGSLTHRVEIFSNQLFNDVQALQVAAATEEALHEELDVD